MLKHSRWMLLAMAGVLLSTADADAFGKRRRGCNGGCNGGYSSCHGGGGGCHGGRVIYNGGHGCHGGRVIHGGCHGGCHGGGVVYGGQPMYYGQGQVVPRDSSYEQGERLPQPRRDARDDFNENGETGQIYFRAPQGAQVWVDGQLVERRGDNWVWTSPNLTGRRSFEVRARWNEDGRVVNRTRSINVQSGGRTTLDFNRPEGSEILPAAGESDRDNQGNQRPGADRDSQAPRSNTTPNTTPRPRDTQPQTRPNDLQPRNPANPRDNGTLPKAQPRPEDR